MAEFISEANIVRYNELLATETDARKIAMIRTLLAEEEARLADLHQRTSARSDR